MRVFFNLAAFLSLAAANLPAMAHDRDLPPPDPPGRWRQVGRTDADSSERCAGHPLTQLCTLHFFYTCFLRGQDALCATALGLDEPPGLFAKPSASTARVLYRVVSARRLKARDIPPRWENRPLPWEKGDVQIGVVEKVCSEDGPCIRITTHPIIFTLRPSHGGWKIIHWYNERGDD